MLIPRTINSRFRLAQKDILLRVAKTFSLCHFIQRKFDLCSLHIPQFLEEFYVRGRNFKTISLLCLGKVTGYFHVARYEEAMYVRFMRDVTDEVLDRGIYTDRALRQVFKAHIARNRDKLDEVHICCFKKKNLITAFAFFVSLTAD